MALYDVIKDKPDLNVFKREITLKTRLNRILESVTIELLPICNFQCPFCYARKSKSDLELAGEHILSFEEWKPIFDELAKMNVLSISFTGGECTLHKDFCKIYKYCYNLGFDIDLLTNCSNITDEMIEMFKQMPPNNISTTIYAASPAGYKNICGNEKYYDIVISNVKKLNSLGFNLLIKQTISSENIEDTLKIYDFAEKENILFKCSTSIMKFGSCVDDEIVKNKIDKKTTSEVFNLLREKQYKIKASDVKAKKIFPISYNSRFEEHGIKCSAGRNNAYINYNGEMCPCVTLDAIKVDLMKYDIKDAWNQIVKWADEVPTSKECFECPFYFMCVSCFAAHYNDTKQFGVPSPRLCWKVQHPEKAEKLLKYYEENGYIMSDMLDD